MRSQMLAAIIGGMYASSYGFDDLRIDTYKSIGATKKASRSPPPMSQKKRRQRARQKTV